MSTSGNLFNSLYRDLLNCLVCLLFNKVILNPEFNFSKIMIDVVKKAMLQILRLI